MTDYRLSKKNKKIRKSSAKSKHHTINEDKRLSSSGLESDKVSAKSVALARQPSHLINVKRPSSFAAYGSARNYYSDAVYNIINYYPFDGTREEVIDWYLNSNRVDIALLKQSWPGSVGHLAFNYNQYIKFYAGPNKIPEAEFVGNYVKQETGLEINPSVGNTVEFWMKKSSFDFSETPLETVFDIGSYPGKLASSDHGQFKIQLSETSGSPFRLTYKVGTNGFTAAQIGSGNVTSSSVADSNWHHYAIKVWHDNEEQKLYAKMYIDGKYDSLTSISVTTIGSVKSFLGGQIASDHGSSSATLSASLDDFRFWKGQRSSREIGRYFDKKVYASNINEKEYSSRLGLYYKFNKPEINRVSVDNLVIDYSGFDIVGRVANYNNTSRVMTSAITEATVTENTEFLEPVLDQRYSSVQSLREDLEKIGQAHDDNNNNSLSRFIPEWAREGLSQEGESTEFDILLRLLATELDNIKFYLDELMTRRDSNWNESNRIIEAPPQVSGSSIVYPEGTFFGCVDDIPETMSTRYRPGTSELISSNSNFSVASFFQNLINASDDVENIYEHLQSPHSAAELDTRIREDISTTLHHLKTIKGTENSTRLVYKYQGLDNTFLTDMVLSPGADIYLSDEDVEIHTENIKSINFYSNQEATLYMSASAVEQSKSFINNVSGSNSAEYCFEGSFIFPDLLTSGTGYSITDSSIFGVREVNPTDNNLTTLSPDRANLTIKVKKSDINSQKAKFILSSDSMLTGDVETSYFSDVYKNSNWNLSVRIRKTNPGTFITNSDDSYELVFSGYNYVSDVEVNTFNHIQPVTRDQYTSFNEANKTFFIGSARENITGSVLQKSDVKALCLSAWDSHLEDEDLKSRAKNPAYTGRRRAYLATPLDLSDSKVFYRPPLFRTQFESLSPITTSQPFTVLDETGGSTDASIIFGKNQGSVYDFTSIGFDSNFSNILNTEHMPVVRNIPIMSTTGINQTQVKLDEIHKFDLDSRPEVKIFSFEKSLYQSISRDMIQFLGGVLSFNNLIGEVVNKYRKNYKILDHIRERYFSYVEDDIEFERYVNYYRWTSRAIGELLEQVIPASALSNTGIENVVESHAFERNKYQHKYNRLKSMPPDLKAQLLSINELLYDWEHGHAPLSIPASTAATGTITTTGNPSNGEIFSLTDADGLTVVYIFKTGLSTVDGTKASGRVVIGVSGATGHAASVGDRMRAAIIASDLNVTVTETSGGAMSLTQNTKGISGNTPIDMTAVTTVTSTNFSGGTGQLEDNNCVWQKDRKELSSPRSPIQNIVTTKISGSTYVLRNLTKPYKFSTDIQKSLNIGSNRNANKIKDLYKIVNEGKELKIPKDKIYESTSCKDPIDPHAETLYSAHVNVPDSESYLNADSDLMLPFSMYSSPIGTDFNSFKDKLKITNNHDDGQSIQNTAMWDFAGGMPHRRVKIGTPQGDRPEAYEISTNNNEMVIKKSSTQASMFHRDIAGSRLYNLANIKTLKSENALIQQGNYSKDYEIVLTNGRSMNNNYLVENEGAHLTGNYNQSTYIQGATDFFVPARTKREHVIVNQFSAPGDASSASPSGRDRESLEYSIYNTINYRNGTIRDVQNFLSRERSDQFGYRPVTSSATGKVYIGSSHKTNRNTLKLTSSNSEVVKYDNHFVQHQIPQNDYGYSWITASAHDGVYDYLNKNANTGHQHAFTVMDTNNSPETINFVSSSEVTSALDFVQLNTHTTRSLSSTENLISNNLTDLNSIVLNQQGPYGWPSWKQTRGSEHSVTRRHRKENTYSIVFHGSSPNARSKQDYSYDHAGVREYRGAIATPRTLKNYDEMFATAKFNPITITLHTYETEELENLNTTMHSPVFVSQPTMAGMWNLDEYVHEFLSRNVPEFRSVTLLPSISFRAGVQNDITGYANQDMARDVRFKEKSFLSHENLAKINLYINQATRPEQTLGENTLIELNYIETIYPREINTFTEEARNRKHFDFFGWKSAASSRELILTGNLNYSNFLISDSKRRYFSLGTAAEEEKEYSKIFFNHYESIDLISTGSTTNVGDSRHITASSWPLDGRRDLSVLPVNITASFFSSGEQFLESRDQGSRGEGILQNDYSIFNLGINALHGAPPFAPVYNRRIPQSYSGNSYLAGEAEWTAAKGTKLGPFYDEYKDFSEEIKLVGQEYSLIPEFTISKFVEDLYATGNVSNVKVSDDFLHLTGAVYHSSSGDLSVGTQFFKTYSTTDFMKYFQSFQENLENNDIDLTEGRLTLRCSAIKRLLPYRGFYPAERAVQISELFNRNYMSPDSYELEYLTGSIGESTAKNLLKLKIQNSKSKVSKPLFGPGILFNSIKSGLAVDYPIYSSSVSGAVNYLVNNNIDESVRTFSDFELTDSTCFTGSEINSTVDEGIPRIRGEVSRRINFEDLLVPERIFDEVIYDNEPHASASNLYGDRDFLRVLEHSPKFGKLDEDDVAINNNFKITQKPGNISKGLRPYKSAINNFAAETVKFFIEGEKLQTIVSEPANPLLTSGVDYKMRVYMLNRNISMYDRHSAFGPPVDEGDVVMSKYESQETVIPATIATASINFAGSSTYFPNPGPAPISLTASYGFYNLFDDDADYFPGFAVTGSASGANKRVHYYHSGDLTGSLIRIGFPDLSKMNSQATAAMALTSEADAVGIEITGYQGSGSVRFYNSDTSPVTTSDSDFIDIYHPSQSRLKTEAELAAATHNQLSSSLAHSFAFHLDGGQLSLFSKSTNRKFPASYSLFGPNSNITASFIPYGAAGSSTAFALVTTSSATSGAPYNFAPEEFEYRAFAGLSHIPWTQAIDSINAASALRYVDLRDASTDATDAVLTGSLLAQLTVEAIHELNASSSFGVTASVDSSTNTIVRLTQVQPGSPGNTPINDVFQNFSTASFVSAVDETFAGGSDSDSNAKKFLVKVENIQSSSHGYLPYVPPYLDPNTSPYAEITFTPTQTRAYTVPEIISGMSVEYANLKGAPNNPSQNTNYKDSMSLSASVDFTKSMRLHSDLYSYLRDSSGMQITTAQNSDLHRWVIQTKWETPVLDFSSSSVETYNLSTGMVNTAEGSPWKTRYQTDYYNPRPDSANTYVTSSTGMWHQKGAVPDTNNGYFLTVVGYGASGTGTGNLAKEVGFESETRDQKTKSQKVSFTNIQKKVGQIAESKIISEAVVAIPYYLTEDCEVVFFDMNRSLYDYALHYNDIKKNDFINTLRAATNAGQVANAKDRYLNFFEGVSLDTVSNIAYQLRMMDKYIMPPHLDFTKNRKIDPFVAYIFQFKSKLTNEDLSDIWQNIYPTNEDVDDTKASIANKSRAKGTPLESDVEYLTHTLNKKNIPNFKDDPSMYDSRKFLKEDVRWLVFKIKYRAESSFDKLRKVSAAGHIENVSNFNDDATQRKTGAPGTPKFVTDPSVNVFEKYSYNWPYDYFSLVEMIKVESKVDFYSSPPEEEVQMVTSAYTSRQEDTDQRVYQITSVGDTSVSSSSTSSTGNEVLVIRQELKADNSAPPSPANTLTISIDSGFTLKTNSESIYVNGLLQVAGASADYTISNNVVTFTFNLVNADSVYVTYLKKPD